MIKVINRAPASNIPGKNMTSEIKDKTPFLQSCQPIKPVTEEPKDDDKHADKIKMVDDGDKHVGSKLNIIA